MQINGCCLTPRFHNWRVKTVKVGSEVSYCRERAFRGPPRLQARSHFVPESVPLPVVAHLHYVAPFCCGSFPATCFGKF